MTAGVTVSSAGSCAGAMFFSASCAGARAIQEPTMLYYAVVFFIIAVVAAILGFGGIAAGAASIAKILFIVFVVLFIASLLFGAVRR
ncbi:membrane hypothetical protein [Paraburkholderia sacchari]